MVSHRIVRCRRGAAAVATLLTAISAAVVASAGGQERRPAPADTAALVLQGRPVTVFRAPLGALSPGDRALAAARRLDSLAESADSSAPVGTRREAAGVLVTVGGRGVFVITPGDLDVASGETLEQAAAAVAGRLTSALAAEREVRSLPHLLRAAGLAAVATVLFLLALRVLVWLRRRAVARLPVAAAPRLRDVGVGGFSFLRADQLLAFAHRAVDLTAWAAGIVLAYLWLTYVLTRFAYSRPWGEALGAYLIGTVTRLALGALAAIPGLFTVVLIFVVTRWAVRLVGGFFDAVESRGVEVPWVHPETANPTKRLASAMLWLFALVVAYPYMPGSGSDVFKGVSVFAGLVISLGSSGVMNQAMSGLVLMYSRALKPGDYVRVGDTEGVVTELGMLSTKIRTTKREEITLPNAVVVGATVKNYSRLAAAGDGVIVYTTVTIGYDTPWRQVDAMLRLAAERTPGLRREPPPFVLQTALSDFYIEYQLNAHLEAPERRAAVLSALHANIVDAFNEYGVQIMSPHYEGDPPRPAVVPRERWYASPAAAAAAPPRAADEPRAPGASPPG